MTLRLIAALFGPILAALYFLHYNRSNISVRLSAGWTVDIPLAALVLGAALLGVLTASLVSLTRSSVEGLRGWRERRRTWRRERARQRFSLALRLRGEGNLRRARRHARKAIRKDPHHAGAMTLAGDLAAELGDFRDALKWHGRAQALDPESGDLAVRLSADLEASGRVDDAEKVLARSLGGSHPHPAALRRLRDLFQGAGKWTEALAPAERLAPLGGTAAEKENDRRALQMIRLAAAEELISRARGGQAAALLEEAVRAHPGDSAPRLRLGDVSLADGRERKALRAWEAGYKELGTPGFLHRILSLHRGADGDGLKRQAAAMSAASRSRPQDPLPAAMAAALYMEAGNWEEAQQWLKAGAEAAHASREEPIWVELVLHLLEARRTLEAGDRLAAENAFRRVAEEAGRRILDRSPAVVELGPVEAEAQIDA
ncbi:MAG: hypothetical protein O2807_03550 [bacterium]|nr:hypothetical protein [bacterium]